MTPIKEPLTIGPDFQGIYTPYELPRPAGIPDIMGGMTFQDANTLLIGGGAASA